MCRKETKRQTLKGWPFALCEQMVVDVIVWVHAHIIGNVSTSGGLHDGLSSSQ